MPILPAYSNGGSSGGGSGTPDDNSVTSAKIANGAVTGPKIAPGAVTSTRLAAGAVVAAAIAAGAVGTASLADGAITAAKIEPSVLSQTAEATVAGPPMQFFSIGGQSNGTGASHISLEAYQGRPNEYGEESPVGGVFEISRAKTDAPRYSPPAGIKRRLEYVGANQANADSNSMVFHFAKEYKRLNPGVKSLVLSNRAVGATGFFDNNWNPGDTQYNAMIGEAQDFMQTPEGIKHEWMGIIWVGGENDANDRQSTTFMKTRLADMWTNAKDDMGDDGLGAILVLPSMSKAWRDETSSSGGSDVTPAHKDAIHQAMIEYADENDDVVFVDVDVATTLETDNTIHRGNNNCRLGGREIGKQVTRALFGLRRSTELPEYRFVFDGEEYSESISGAGIIHNQRLVFDDDEGWVLTTEDTPGSSTWTAGLCGYETEIAVNQEAYTISMRIKPIVEIPASNIVTFAIGGENDGTLRFMGYGGLRHLTYGGSSSNWNGDLAVDRWDTITATFDGTNLRVYHNGTEVLNSPQTAAAVPGIGDMRLGFFDTLASSFFKGYMKDIVVLPYALGAAGVAMLHD